MNDALVIAKLFSFVYLFVIIAFVAFLFSYWFGLLYSNLSEIYIALSAFV